MKKAIRIFAAALLALAALLGAAAVGFSSYVRSPATQKQIEEKLDRALGMPLKISDLSVSPLGALRIKSARIPQTDANAGGGNFLDAGELVARFRLLPLLAGRLEVTSVKLTEPRVAWTQDAHGKWVVPGHAHEKKPKSEKIAEPKKSEPKQQFDFAVSHFKIQNGSFDFRDAKHRQFAHFERLDVDAKAITGETASGSARCASAGLLGVLFPKYLRADFHYHDGQLALTHLDAEIAGGTFRGEFQIDSGAPDSPFNATAQLENVDANRLVIESAGKAGQIAGILSANLDLRGTTRDTDSLTGGGRLALRDGHLAGNEILQLIGEIVRIEELSRLDFREAQADFHVAGGKVLVDSLTLQSQNLRLAIKGTFRIDDGKISDCTARLSVNEKTRRRIPELIARQMTPAENGDGAFIDFAIKGSLTKPRTDLGERIVGKEIEKQIGGLLDGIFGKKKDDNKKKKRAGEMDAPLPPPAK